MENSVKPIRMAEYCKKYGLSASSFNHWLKRGLIGRSGTVQWGGREVPTYVDVAPVQQTTVASAEKYVDGEVADVLAVANLMQVLGLRGRTSMTGYLNSFKNVKPEAVVEFTLFPEAENGQVGLLGAYLSEFVDFLGLDKEDLVRGGETSSILVADASVLASYYPYNLAKYMLVGKNGDDSILFEVNAQRLLALIDRLSDDVKSMLEAHFLRGLTFDQIGEPLGLAKGSVHYQINHALDTLRYNQDIYLASGYFALDDSEVV